MSLVSDRALRKLSMVSFWINPERFRMFSTQAVLGEGDYKRWCQSMIPVDKGTVTFGGWIWSSFQPSMSYRVQKALPNLILPSCYHSHLLFMIYYMTFFRLSYPNPSSFLVIRSLSCFNIYTDFIITIIINIILLLCILLLLLFLYSGSGSRSSSSSNSAGLEFTKTGRCTARSPRGETIWHELQIGCIGPLIYSIIHKCSKVPLSATFIILTLLLFCCMCTALTALFWSQTAFIFGQQRSVALMILVFGMFSPELLYLYFISSII